MRNLESVKEVYFEGNTLIHAGYGNNENYGLNNNKVTLFYINQGPINESPNHYAVTWDFSEFFESEKTGTFEWPSPHAAVRIEEDRKQSIIDYFNSTKFVPYGREVKFNGSTLTIINRPVEYAPAEGTLRYYAGATDQEGNVYQVFWNLFNMFEPSEIEMTVDNSRYCKHCLQRWTSSANQSKCNHEWIKN